MKAVVFEKCGEPSEVLTVCETKTTQPQRGEVRIRMLASPVNPSDLLFIRGEYGKSPKLPASPGFEGVGIVEESGGGILGWRVKGRRVAVLNSKGGNWAEEVIIPARQAVPVPEDLTDEQAATFFVNPASALVMTQDVLRIPKGAWLLQSAAGGALGKMIIRLGKEQGFRTINLVRREEQIDELKKLGADEVLCDSEANIIEKVENLTQGKGVPFAIDPVGGQTASAMVQCLSSEGRMLVYGSLSNETIAFHSRRLITGSKRIEGFWLSEWVQRQGILKMLRLFRRISRFLRGGTLDTHIGQIFSVDDVQQAVQEAETPGHQGKVLIRLQQCE